MTSTKHSLTGPLAFAHEGLAQGGPGYPGQRSCLFDVGFPLSGSRVWIFTSCLLVMPIAHAYAARGISVVIGGFDALGRDKGP